MVSEERRIDLRGIREERIFIKVASCKTQPDLENTTFSCSTIDVSSTGMRLSVVESIPSETQLELWVEIKGIPGKFLLQGKIKWSMPRGEDYICGIELDETDEDSDIIDWQDLFI